MLTHPGATPLKPVNNSSSVQTVNNLFVSGNIGATGGSSLISCNGLNVSGNLGIGTTNPVPGLDVNNNITGRSIVYVVSSENNTTAALTANNGQYLTVEAFNSDNTVKRNICLAPYGGNIAIGKTTADYSLDVNTHARIGNYTVINYAGGLLKSVTDAGTTIFGNASLYSGSIYMNCDYNGYDRTASSTTLFSCCKNTTGSNIAIASNTIITAATNTGEFNAVISLVPTSGSSFDVRLTTSGSRSGAGNISIKVTLCGI